MEKEKAIIRKIAGDMTDHAKTQHEITKARHEVLKKSPAQAKEEFKQRHADAKKSPKQKQQEELARLRAQKNG